MQTCWQPSEHPHMSLPKLGDNSAQQLINFATSEYWGIKDSARFEALMEEAKSLVTPKHCIDDTLFALVEQQRVGSGA
jgi:hypothetical protein